MQEFERSDLVGVESAFVRPEHSKSGVREVDETDGRLSRIRRRLTVRSIPALSRLKPETLILEGIHYAVEGFEWDKHMKSGVATPGLRGIRHAAATPTRKHSKTGVCSRRVPRRVSPTAQRMSPTTRRMSPIARRMSSTDVPPRSHVVGVDRTDPRGSLVAGPDCASPGHSNAGALERRSTRKPVRIQVSPDATLAVTRSHSQSTRNPPV